DDVLISRYLRPRLTTIRYPVVAMATQAAELALALANNTPLPETTNMFSPTLVRRHSVASPQTMTHPQTITHPQTMTNPQTPVDD
ncbi:TPA: substrate-binding domain-containing protein, partial [Yersinia enterocolitica]|nr:substrate-binding domain-containing protein [Yersinia enterocolitica]